MGRSIAEATGIFAVSLLVLFMISVVTAVNTHKGWGIGYYNAKGYTFIVQGGLYCVFGLLLTRWHR
jgi:hypothetical protein